MNPLRTSGRADVSAKRNVPKPPPRQTAHESSPQAGGIFSDFEPADAQHGGEMSFLRPGVRHAQFRKLRKGGYAIRSHLDLHGMTVAEARQQLAIFLQESRQHGERCVRVICGKGYHSRDRQPILKGKLNQWLRQSGEVLAFCTAPAADGGSGAIYVLLTAR